MATYIPNVQDVLPDVKMFTPDFSFIDKMMQRKSSQYLEGWNQLNNQYNLINRDVTNPMNLTTRDEFLKSAKSNLKDLSAMDLSDPTNVNSAASVFKPFYNNQMVLGDQAITSFWNDQIRTGESYRLKDGGKEFSVDNLKYIQKQMNDFKNDDPSSVGQYTANKRYYTPYYDYDSEIKEAIKNFKPTHKKVETVKGLYTVTDEDQSWTKLELSQYLNSVLSGKAKQQMRIEGDVRLGTNPEFLTQTYMTTEASKIPDITKLIDKYDIEIKTEKDPNKLAILQQNRAYYDSQRSEISNNIKSIKSGDLSFLKKNSESLAYSAYSTAIIDKYAEGSAHADYSHTIDADQVGMMYARQDFDWKKMLHEEANSWQRLYYTEDKADKRAAATARAAGSTDFLPLVPTGPRTVTPIDISPEGMNNTLNELQVGQHNKFLDLVNNIATSELAKNKYGITSSTEIRGAKGQNLIKEYMRLYPNDPKVLNYLDAGHDTYNQKLLIWKDKKAADAQVMNAVGGKKNFAILQKYEQVLAATKGNEKLAIQATGVDPNRIQSLLGMANGVRTTYYNDKHRKIAASQPGVEFNTEDKRYKITKGYLNSGINGEDIAGIGMYPQMANSNMFDLSVRLKPGSATYKIFTAGTNAEKSTEINRLKSIYNMEETPIFDNTQMAIVLPKKGSAIPGLAQIDPLYGVPNNNRRGLEAITNVNLNPSEQTLAARFSMKDQSQVTRNVEIYGLKNNDNSMDYYYKINGVKQEQSYANARDAHAAAEQLIRSNTSATINAALNSAIKF